LKEKTVTRILILLLSTSSFANQFDINHLVKALNTKYLSIPHTFCAEAKAENKNLMQCTQDLCGKASDDESIVLYDEKLRDLEDSKIEAEFIRDKHYFEDNLKRAIDYNQDLLKAVKEKKLVFNLTTQDLAAIVYKDIVPHLDIIHNLETGKLKISHDSIKKMSDQSKVAVKKVISYIKENASKDFKLAFDSGISIPPSLITQEANKLKLLLASKVGPGANLDNVTNQINSVIAPLKNTDNKTPTKQSGSVAVKLDQLRSYFYKVLKIEQNIIPSSLCSDGNCKKFFDEKIATKVTTNIKMMEKQLKAYKEIGIDKISNSCKGNYYFDKIEKNRNAVQDSQFVERNIEKVLSYIKDKYSEDSFKRFNDFVSKELKVGLDDKTSFKLSNSELAVAAAKQDSQSIQEDHLEFKIGGLNDSKILNQFMGKFKNGMATISLLDNICMGDMTKGLSLVDDHYSPWNNFVKFSQYTCEHQGKGAGIIAHELGHVFSDILASGSTSRDSLKKYKKRRDCVSSQYLIPEYNHTRAKLFNKDHFRSEEDMADFFSAMVSEFHKEKEDNNSLMACALIPIKENNYQSVSIENRAFDPHSSALIRALREASYKKLKLSTSCSKVLNDNSHLLKNKKCDSK
jgi:hypothetical protein